MTWRTHTLAGIASLWTQNIFPPGIAAGETGLLAAFAAFGALLPDLDANISKLTAWSVEGIRPLMPASLIARLWGHRGPLHSIPGLGVAAGLAILLAPTIGMHPAMALWTGYASHIIMDACTITGIPGKPVCNRIWLLPKQLRIRTGSSGEDIVFALLLLPAAYLLLRVIFGTS